MTNTSGSAVVMTLEETIAYHLEYNHEIPFPQEYIQDLVPACIEAIRAVNDHNLYKEIALPKGVTAVDSEGKEFNTMQAYEIVAACHLFQWLNDEWF